MATSLHEHAGRGEVPTGVLFVDESVPDVHERHRSTRVPLNQVPLAELCPGAATLDALQAAYR